MPFRQVGVYTGQILKGASCRPAGTAQPTKLRFVINLKAARALGDRISRTAACHRRRGDRMRRLAFITLLVSGAAVAWPPPVSGQQAPMPVVGVLSSQSQDLRGRGVGGVASGVE